MITRHTFAKIVEQDFAAIHAGFEKSDIGFFKADVTHGRHTLRCNSGELMQMRLNRIRLQIAVLQLGQPSAFVGRKHLIHLAGLGQNLIFFENYLIFEVMKLLTLLV